MKVKVQCLNFAFFPPAPPLLSISNDGVLIGVHRFLTFCIFHLLRAFIVCVRLIIGLRVGGIFPASGEARLWDGAVAVTPPPLSPVSRQNFEVIQCLK